MMKTRKRSCRMRAAACKTCKTKSAPSLLGLGAPFLGLFSAHLALPTATLAAAAAAAVTRARDMQPTTTGCSPLQTKAVVSITFDDYPAEISWRVADASSESVVCSRNFANEGFSGGQTVLDRCCLDHRHWEEMPEQKKENDGSGDDSASMDDRQLQPAGREYTFTILDSYGDGMCCSHGRGSYTVSIEDEVVVDGRSSSAASFGSSASTSFIVEGETPTPTPTPAPWWAPDPTEETTMHPSDSFELYDCPPTSVMGSQGFFSEFNGCVTPSGCRFLATPYWDIGSFDGDVCWYCCSSAGDTCGVCSGCECGYFPSATPAPTPWIEASEMPTYGYPPLEDDLSPEASARIVWSGASRGRYPWHEEQDCIEHPTNFGGRDEEYAAVVSAMIQALRDHRLDWDIADAMMFNIHAHIPMQLGQCEPLVSTARTILDVEGGRKLPALEQLQPQLRRAVRSFVARMEEEDSQYYRTRPKAIIGVLIFITMLVVGGIFVCMVNFSCTILRRGKKSDGNGQECSTGSGAAAGGIAVAGSLISSATILPSMAEVPPIPVASAVPVPCTADEENVAVTLLAKVLSMDAADNAVPRPSAPPPPPSAAPKYTETEEDIGLAAGESLAVCLSEAGSFGRTEAIADWMRDNSQLASTFSPEDMALALSAVSFSLDQPLAAKEIAAGVGKNDGRITGDHVVGALGVCDRSARLEVARGMAPFVSDLENEETILSLFESSYEREQVDRALNG